MKIINKNLTLAYILVFAPVFFGAINFAFAENTSANIENNISATANAGGNKIEGSGTIKTGDASASVKAENYASGEEKVQTKAEARAEVQGEGARATVEVNGEKKTCEASGEGGCAVEISNGENGINGVDESSGINGSEGDNGDKYDGEKNIIQSAASAISNLAKSITNKIISWFS